MYQSTEKIIAQTAVYPTVWILPIPQNIMAKYHQNTQTYWGHL